MTTQALQVILTNVVSVIIRDPISLIGVLTLLFVQQPKLTLLSITVLPVCIVPIAIYGTEKSGPFQPGNSNPWRAELVQTMTEGFTGHRVIKAYNLEKITAEKFHDTTRKSIGLTMRITRALEIPGILIEFFGACGIAIMLACIIGSSGPRPQPWDFLQLLGSFVYIYQPLKNLTRLHNQVVQARAATERVKLELMATKNFRKAWSRSSPKMLHGRGTRLTSGSENAVGTDCSEKAILRDINLDVKAGQLVAFVGKTGSGKTTLANLLLRFWRPWPRGTIKIGGVDLRDVSTFDLRGQMAVVAQENILFNDTIRRNIELGRLGATKG